MKDYFCRGPVIGLADKYGSKAEPSIYYEEDMFVHKHSYIQAFQRFILLYPIKWAGSMDTKTESLKLICIRLAPIPGALALL